MKRFEPAITIWNVWFTDKVDGTIVGNEYFLFYKQAEKYADRCRKSKEYDDVNICLGGETLWIW